MKTFYLTAGDSGVLFNPRNRCFQTKNGKLVRVVSQKEMDYLCNQSLEEIQENFEEPETELFCYIQTLLEEATNEVVIIRHDLNLNETSIFRSFTVEHCGHQSFLLKLNTILMGEVLRYKAQIVSFGKTTIKEVGIVNIQLQGEEIKLLLFYLPKKKENLLLWAVG